MKLTSVSEFFNRTQHCLGYYIEYARSSWVWNNISHLFDTSSSNMLPLPSPLVITLRLLSWDPVLSVLRIPISDSKREFGKRTCTTVLLEQVYLVGGRNQGRCLSARHRPYLPVSGAFLSWIHWEILACDFIKERADGDFLNLDGLVL